MAKYTIEKGIYKKDGKPCFALGVSYYPSYHEKKVPVPEDGDRIGELNKDIKGMRDFGFNIVRCAALGDVYYNESREVVTNTPLLDAIAERCAECEVGLMLRLQGYSMNLSGYTDTLMIDQDGKEMNKSVWYDFVRDCLFHEGLREDNDAGTKALAEHFMKFPATVGWQTYNEPHYPSGGTFDYHPKTVAAYRKWLVERGYKSEDETRDFDPPRMRPAPGESAEEWIRWRTFSHDAMTDFLCHSSDVAKSASGLETMTCITSGPSHSFLPIRGEDYFRIAEGMDALGITQYFLVRKPEVYTAAMNLSLAESAAALADKPLWIIEYDAKTDSPPDYFARNTYLALGVGIKGLLYYQWRGDHIYPDSPEGNGFGIINYDGTKTIKYALAKKIVDFINAHSELLLGASKHRSGVGILRSFRGFTASEAKANPNAVGIAAECPWLERENTFFTELAKRGIICDFTRAEDLKENKLGIKLLYVPNIDLISKEERVLIEDFENAGGKIVCTNRSCRDFMSSAYEIKEINRTKFTSYLDASDVLYIYGTMPVISFDAREEALLLQTLDAQDGYVAVITNIDNVGRPNVAPTLSVPSDIKRAVYESFDEPAGQELEIKYGKVTLPKIEDGCFVRLIK